MIKLATVLSTHSQMERQGVKYGLGAKALPLSAPPDMIRKIDCSGYVRYVLSRAGLTIPDGSQMQRAWCESHVGAPDGVVIKKVQYENLMLPEVMADPTRLFICFIKPFTNGCGKIGHVFLIFQGETMESCGSRGVCSRDIKTGVLRRQAYSTYELKVE